MENNHKNIDNVIDLVTNISALNYILPNKNTENIIKVNNIEYDPSVKEDGVYDIDENCLLSTNNAFNIPSNLIILIFILFIISK